MRQRPTAARDRRIVIVEVNETDLATLKQWPTSDRRLAQALTTISQGQPAVIGLDLYRNFAVEPGHTELEQVFRTTPNLIGITKQNGDRGRQIAAPATLAALGQVAVNDLIVDDDGRLRRAFLYLTTPDATHESLGLRLALTYLEQRGITPDQNATMLTLGKTRFPPLEANDGGYVGADAGGEQMLLNYRGNIGHFERISLSDILHHRVSPDRFRDRVVLLGVTAISLKDSFLTPYSQGSKVDQPLEMPGVEFHANVVSQILSQVLGGRSGLRTLSEPLEILSIIGWTILGTGLTWRWRFLIHCQRRRQKLALVIGLGLALPIGYGIAFSNGWWLPIAPLALAYFGGMALVIGHTAYRAGEIRQTFGRYLSDEVVSQLLESPQGKQLGGQRRHVTMLISDLRGFSAIAEQHPPEQVMALLNHYLAVMTTVIEQYQGTIDELMGDSILVIFGAPTQRSDDVDRALHCAIAMQLAMDKLREQLSASTSRELDPAIAAEVRRLEMGVGIHTGEVVVGNIGSIRRAKYGIVGTNINLAARIESYTVGGQVLISEASRQAAQVPLLLGRSIRLQAKGFTETVMVHDLQAIAGHDHLTLPVIARNLTPLDVPLKVECSVIDGKVTSPTPGCFGEIHQLSLAFAELHLPTALPPFTNLRLTLRSPDSRTPANRTDFYAKITQTIATEGFHHCIYQIRFTSVPIALQQQFEQLFPVVPSDGGRTQPR
jgi:adenylate cyclase